MAQRDWTLPVDSERPEHWNPDTDVGVFDANDDDALIQEAVNAIWVLKRLGGTVGLIAVREEIAPGIFETKGIAVRWESYAPARRLPKEPPPAEPEIDGEPPLTAEEIEEVARMVEREDALPAEADYAAESEVDGEQNPEPRPEDLAFFDSTVAETASA